MSRIPKTVPTIAVHAGWWANDEEVCIKTFISSTDYYRLRAVIEPSLARQKALADKSDATPQELEASIIQERDVSQVLLTVCVQSWTFRYDEEDGGGPIPLSPETLAALAPDDLAFLVGEINACVSLWKRGPDLATEEDARAAAFRREKAPVSGIQGTRKARRAAARAS